jgi:hypothetical protein
MQSKTKELMAIFPTYQSKLLLLKTPFNDIETVRKRKPADRILAMATAMHNASMPEQCGATF